MSCESVVYLRDRSTGQSAEDVLYDSTDESLRQCQMVSIAIEGGRKLFFEGEQKEGKAVATVLCVQSIFRFSLVQMVIS